MLSRRLSHIDNPRALIMTLLVGPGAGLRVRHPVLGFRHWDQVKEEVQREFDQESESFTLEQIVKLGMDQHVEKISEISASATKELAIEVV